MTRYLRNGSKLIRKDTFYNPPDDDVVSHRVVWIIVDGKHKPVFHRDGFMMTFIFKKKAQEFLEKDSTPREWRAMKVLQNISHV